MEEEVKSPGIEEPQAKKETQSIKEVGWTEVKRRFKENWNKTDTMCECCGQVKEKAKGLNKQNLKKLIFGKPSVNDLITFFIILCVLFMAYQYNIETAQCREWVQRDIAFFDNQSAWQKNNPLMPNESNSKLFIDPNKLDLTKFKINSTDG